MSIQQAKKTTVAEVTKTLKKNMGISFPYYRKAKEGTKWWKFRRAVMEGKGLKEGGVEEKEEAAKTKEDFKTDDAGVKTKEGLANSEAADGLAIY